MTERVQVTWGEMREFLSAEKGWAEPRVGIDEHILDWPIPHNDTPSSWVIRVYTGVSKTGSDDTLGTIQDCVIDIDEQRGLIQNLRVPYSASWRKTLRQRIECALQQAREAWHTRRMSAARTRRKAVDALRSATHLVHAHTETVLFPAWGETGDEVRLAATLIADGGEHVSLAQIGKLVRYIADMMEA